MPTAMCCRNCLEFKHRGHWHGNGRNNTS